MKKIASFFIIAFALTYILGVGFLILKTSIMSDTSNLNIIRSFLIPQVPVAMPIPTSTPVQSTPIVEAMNPPVKKQKNVQVSAVAKEPSRAATTTNPLNPEQALEIAKAELIHLQMLLGTSTP